MVLQTGTLVYQQYWRAEDSRLLPRVHLLLLQSPQLTAPGRTLRHWKRRQEGFHDRCLTLQVWIRPTQLSFETLLLQPLCRLKERKWFQHYDLYDMQTCWGIPSQQPGSWEAQKRGVWSNYWETETFPWKHASQAKGRGAQIEQFSISDLWWAQITNEEQVHPWQAHILRAHS